MFRYTPVLAAIVLTIGCQDTKPNCPVLLQAYDPLTGEPLAGVNVVRWDFELRFNDTSVFPVPIGATGSDGLKGSEVPYYPSFMLHRAGYGSAEVRIVRDTAYVASPSLGNRSYRLYNRDPVEPTRYEQYVPARPLIRVPMWPSGPATRHADPPPR